MTEPKDELLLDHEYDGIKELDNQLPGWWLWLFYLSTIFAVLYLGWYHVLRKGPLQTEQYDLEMAEARRLGLGLHYEAWGLEVEPALAADVLAQGENLFVSQCAVCHLPDGGGLIGPNMTDEYFIHGHEFADSIRIIEDGVLAKGMISWKSQLSREQILAVGSYVFMLRGTTPEKAKAPEGEPAPKPEPPVAAEGDTPAGELSAEAESTE